MFALTALAPLAVSAEHAMIKRGLPKLDDIDATLFTNTILVMKDLCHIKFRIAWKEGGLRLIKKLLSYQGNTHAWMRHIGQLECEKWIPSRSRNH